MGEKLSGFLNVLRDAVLILDGKKVEHMNSAAKTLFPERTVGDEIGMFIPEIAENDVITCAVTIKNAEYNLNVTELDGKKALILHMAETENGEKVFELLNSLCGSIRNSLATAHMSAGFLQSFAQQFQDEKLRKYAAAFDHSYYTMLKTVGNISKLCEANVMPPEKEKTVFDFVKLGSEIVEAVSYLMSDRNISVGFSSDLDKLYFKGDEEQLERMILNLLSNSLKYTPDGGNIALSLRQEKKRVYISVKDDGKGISEELIGTVFERYKMPHDLTDVKAGVGLGLYVVKHIAAQHGGSVVIKSRENEGTEIVVSLPINDEGTTLKLTPQKYSSGKMAAVLTELSDVLGYKSYFPKNLD